jgi:hypothetical protein
MTEKFDKLTDKVTDKLTTIERQNSTGSATSVSSFSSRFDVIGFFNSVTQFHRIDVLYKYN